MTPLREISYQNPFRYPFSWFHEIHTYSETDWIERYRGHSIWRYDTGHRTIWFNIIKDGVILGHGNTVEEVKVMIDNFYIS